MKEQIVDERLTQRDVPAMLDARILAAARVAAERRSRARRVRPWFWSVTAAAAGVMVAAGIFVQHSLTAPSPEPSVKAAARSAGAELLALNDWSEFEQQSYVLMKSVGSCSQDLSDWNQEYGQEMFL